VLFATACVILASFPLLADSETEPKTLGEAVEEIRGLVAEDACEDALAELEPLRAEHPDDVDLMVLEGTCLLNRARSTEEIYDRTEYTRRLVGRGTETLPPAVTASFYTREFAWDAEGKRAAIRLYERALEEAPERDDILVGNVALLTNAGEEKRAAKLIREHDERFSGSLPLTREVLQLVLDELKLGRLDAARELTQALEDVAPGLPATHLARLFVALRSEDDDAAIEAASKVRGPTQEIFVPLRELGRRLMMSRRYDEAVPVLLRIANEDLQAAYWLAIARDRISFGSGLSIWEAVTSRLGTEPAPNSHFERAVRHFVRVIRDGRSATEVQHVRAIRFFAERNLPAAGVAEAHQCLEKFPESVPARRELAALYRGIDRFELALETLDEARALAADDARAEIDAARGSVLFALGRDDAAIRAFEEAADAGAADPLAHARVLETLGRARKARALLEDVVERGGEEADEAKKRLTAMSGSAS
jgi:tetratricopeptide (TPR) repeat protein